MSSDSFLDSSFDWASFFGRFHLHASPTSRRSPARPNVLTSLHVQRMKKEGYFPAQMQIHEPHLLDHLREAIEALTRELKAPPSFIFLSDEAWDLAHEALPWLGAYEAKEEEEEEGKKNIISSTTTTSLSAQSKLKKKAINKRARLSSREEHDVDVKKNPPPPPPRRRRQLTGDFLAWEIGAGESGFAPHRDRQPDDIAASFGDGGEGKKKKKSQSDDFFPRYCTMWMTLVDVDGENSPLYAIPACHDPGYWDGDHVDETMPSPMQRALFSAKTDFQHLRVFCGRPGSSFVFSHRLLHFGQKASEFCTKNRISISFVASDPSFEEPYYLKKDIQHDDNKDIQLDQDSNDDDDEAKKMDFFSKKKNSMAKDDDDDDDDGTDFTPALSVRRALICGQMICYHERYNWSRKQLLQFFEIFMESREAFAESYVQKVCFELVSASQQLPPSNQTKNQKKNSQKKRQRSSGGDEDQEEDEEHWEEMLQLAMFEAGDTNIKDDFNGL